MKKRLLSCLLILCMVFSLLPVSALATTDVEVTLGCIRLGQIERTLEMNTGISGYKDTTQQLAPESVTLPVGQQGSFQRLPTTIINNVQYSPKSYGVIRGRCVDVSDPEVVGNFQYSLEYYTGTNYPCLQFNYTAKQVGTATITLEFFYNFGFDPSEVQNGNTWWRQTKTINVTVTDSATEPEKPEKPTVSDIKRFHNKVNTTSSSEGAVYMWCADSLYDHGAWFEDLTEVEGGYSLGEVVANTESNAASYPWVCPMTVYGNKYLAAYNSEPGFPRHWLEDGEPVSQTVNWYYSAQDSRWKFKSSEAPIYFDITHNNPYSEPTMADFANQAILVKCDTNDSHNAQLLYSDGTYTISWAGDDRCTLTFDVDSYVAAYGQTHEGHTAVEGQTVTKGFSYSNGEWRADDTSGPEIHVACESTQPERPTEFGKEQLAGMQVNVQCETVTAHAKSYHFGELDGCYSTSDVMKDNEGGYHVTVTLDRSSVVEKFNADEAAGGKIHDDTEPNASTSWTWTWDANDKAWRMDTAPITDAWATIVVKCEGETQKPDAPTSVSGQFYLSCVNTEASHGMKTGWISALAAQGGSNNYTVGEVQGNATDGYYVEVTVDTAKYLPEYNTFTKATHEIVNDEDKSLVIRFNYANGKWVQQGEMPVVKVTCTNETEVYVYFHAINVAADGTVNEVDRKDLGLTQNGNEGSWYTLGILKTDAALAPVPEFGSSDIIEYGKETEQYQKVQLQLRKALDENSSDEEKEKFNRDTTQNAGFTAIDKIKWTGELKTAKAGNHFVDGGKENCHAYHFNGVLPFYTVSYDTNGGTGDDVPATSGYYLEGEPYTVSNVVLSRDGYTFKGWKLGETTYQAGTEFDMPGENVILVADWEKLCPVELVIYRNGDTTKAYDTKSLGKMPKGTVIDLTKLNIADYYTANYTGKYDFYGWFNDGAWNEYKKNPERAGLDSITVNGWTNIICMVYDYENVVYYMSDADRVADNRLFETTARKGAALPTADAPTATRDGYTFKFWSREGQIGTDVTGQTVGGWTNLVANWEANTYTVTFDPNADDATVSQTSKEVTFDAPYSDLPTPTRAHHTFKGWYLGTDKVTEATIVKTAENHTLRAAWSRSYHALTINYVDKKGNPVADSYEASVALGADFSVTSPDVKGYKLRDKDDAVIEGTMTAAGYTYDVVYVKKSSGGSGVQIESPNKPKQDNSLKFNTEEHFAYINGYPDGTVKPTGDVTRAEVAAILYRVMDADCVKTYETTRCSFSDVVRGDWFNLYVATLENAGVIVDTRTNGKFRPNEAITRAELAAMLAQFADIKSAANSFNDVSARHWASDEIAVCAKMGWINGYPDGSFRPDATITRAEMMAMINRALGRTPKSADDLLSGMKTWRDNANVNAWYYLDVQEATNSHTYTKSGSHETWKKLR